MAASSADRFRLFGIVCCCKSASNCDRNSKSIEVSRLSIIGGRLPSTPPESFSPFCCEAMARKKMREEKVGLERGTICIQENKRNRKEQNI